MQIPLHPASPPSIRGVYFGALTGRERQPWSSVAERPAAGSVRNIRRSHLLFDVDVCGVFVQRGSVLVLCCSLKLKAWLCHTKNTEECVCVSEERVRRQSEGTSINCWGAPRPSLTTSSCHVAKDLRNDDLETALVYMATWFITDKFTSIISLPEVKGHLVFCPHLHVFTSFSNFMKHLDIYEIVKKKEVSLYNWP